MAVTIDRSPAVTNAMQQYARASAIREAKGRIICYINHIRKTDNRLSGFFDAAASLSESRDAIGC